MNIFNAIKYPIHAPITGEQLDNLPRKLYEEWAISVVGGEAKARRERNAFFLPAAFAQYFNGIPEDIQPEYIADLRERILNIENNNDTLSRNQISS